MSFDAAQSAALGNVLAEVLHNPGGNVDSLLAAATGGNDVGLATLSPAEMGHMGGDVFMAHLPASFADMMPIMDAVA